MLLCKLWSNFRQREHAIRMHFLSFEMLSFLLSTFVWLHHSHTPNEMMEWCHSTERSRFLNFTIEWLSKCGQTSNGDQCNSSTSTSSSNSKMPFRQICTNSIVIQCSFDLKIRETAVNKGHAVAQCCLRNRKLLIIQSSPMRNTHNTQLPHFVFCLRTSFANHSGDWTPVREHRRLCAGGYKPKMCVWPHECKSNQNVELVINTMIFQKFWIKMHNTELIDASQTDCRYWIDTLLIFYIFDAYSSRSSLGLSNLNHQNG